MQYKISKELLNSVWKYNTSDFIINQEDEAIEYENNEILYLNTFYFECKEWAKDNGFIITSNYKFSLLNYKYDLDLNKPIMIFKHSFDEIQATIDACEYIMENFLNANI